VTLRFGSVCSGIEAASVAWKPLGWQAAWFSEIEPFPSAVLAHHYPNVPNLGSMVTLPERILAGEVEAPDLLCGGTPCQAFSVAGLRRSLDDARGNLSLTFCELADAIDTVRSALCQQPAIVFWENVPGVLSTADNAFGCFLGRLAGSGCELQPPGRRWSDAGCVFGPARAVAWRILDAQYFGLAQRRRRVFVVASARAGFDPAAVLFEFDGVRRDSAPSRQARQDATASAASGAGVSSVEVAGTLGAHHGNTRADAAWTGQIVPKVVGALDTECGGNKLTHQSIANGHIIGTLTAQFLRSLGPRDVEEGALVPMFLDPMNQTASAELVKTIASRSDMDAAGCVLAHAFDARQSDVLQYGDKTGPLDTDGHSVGVLAFAQNQRDEVRIMDRAGALAAEPGAKQQTYLAAGMQVRRLTPRECERLQGFPDDYTAIPWRGRPAEDCPDGPRYKALGNSWAVPVVRWIGARIQQEVSK